MIAFIRTASAVAAAATLAVAIPIGAQAASPPPYPPAKDASWSAQVCAGKTLTHVLPPGTFGDSRSLREFITGAANAVPLAAMFVAAQTSYSLTSTANGSATVKLTFPANATGTYDVTLTQQVGGKAAVGSIAVLQPTGATCDAPAVTAGDAPTPSDEPLAVTGTHIDPDIAWGAGGAVIVGAILTLVLSRRRQPRRR